MPYQNEHSARLKAPQSLKPIRVRRTSGSGDGKVQGVTIPTTIDIIWYVVKKNSKEVPIAQALRFPVENWTAAEAKSWLEKNDIKYSTFEAAQKTEGEMMYGFEIGELCSEEIEIESIVNAQDLIEGDQSPFFATVKVLKVGRSRNKKNYRMENLQQVLSQLPLYGYKGHVKEEDISTAYREPVTIWIGGKIVGEWLYVKGYIPPQYDTLRKDVALSLRARRPMPVSHLGWYKLIPREEYYDIENIESLSIDWGNAGLEGVKGAQVVEVGREQQEGQQHKEDDMPTREEIIAALSMEEIKKERPDLVESLQSEMQESEEEKKKREDETEKLKTLEKENADLKKQIIDGHREKLLAEIQDEKVREIAGDLLQGETVEELDKSWELVKEKLSKIEKPGIPIVTGADEEKPGQEFIEERLLDGKKGE